MFFKKKRAQLQVCQLEELTQGEGRGSVGEGIQSDSVRRNALVQVEQRVHCKHHHTAWKRLDKGSQQLHE